MACRQGRWPQQDLDTVGVQGPCAAKQGRWLRSAGSLCGGHRKQTACHRLTQREAITGPHGSSRYRTKHKTRE